MVAKRQTNPAEVTDSAKGQVQLVWSASSPRIQEWFASPSFKMLAHRQDSLTQHRQAGSPYLRHSTSLALILSTSAVAPGAEVPSWRLGVGSTSLSVSCRPFLSGTSQGPTVPAELTGGAVASASGAAWDRLQTAEHVTTPEPTTLTLSAIAARSPCSSAAIAYADSRGGQSVAVGPRQRCGLRPLERASSVYLWRQTEGLRCTEVKKASPARDW